MFYDRVDINATDFYFCCAACCSTSDATFAPALPFLKPDHYVARPWSSSSQYEKNRVKIFTRAIPSNYLFFKVFVMSEVVPSHADVVIIGGGVVGCSIAYHLTKLGIRDVVLLERKQLSCGTTWHAAGLVGQLRATRNLTELAKYTTDLLFRLEQETGQATGFKQNG